MPHVEKRNRGGATTWRARYRAPDGSERSRTFTRKFEAEQFLAQVEVDKARGSWVDPNLSHVLFREWAERWLRTTTHLKPKTQSGYASLLRSRLLPAFGDRAIGDIRPIDVREWMSELLGRGLSASSCRQAYHLMTSIMRAAVEDGRLVASPCIGIKLPRLPQVEMAYLSPTQLRRLLEVIPEEHRLFIEVLAIGGLRYGEAVALRRFRCELGRSRLMIAESLADVSGTLYFGPPKTHQRRAVTLPRFLCDRLSEFLADQPDAPRDDLVFQVPSGGPLRYSNFATRVWKPALAAADLPDMGLHALRHTCAALLISQGAHPKAIQSHLGHRSITTTLDRYGHLFEDEHEKLAARIDAAYAGLTGAQQPSGHTNRGSIQWNGKVKEGAHGPTNWS
jgi:integrase